MYTYTRSPDRSTIPPPVAAPAYDPVVFYKQYLDKALAAGKPGNEGYLGHEYAMMGENPGFGSGSSSTGAGPGNMQGRKPGYGGSIINAALGNYVGAVAKAIETKKAREAWEARVAADLANARGAYASHAAKERASANEGYGGGSGGFEGSQGTERLSGV